VVWEGGAGDRAPYLISCTENPVNDTEGNQARLLLSDSRIPSVASFPFNSDLLKMLP